MPWRRRRRVGALAAAAVVALLAGCGDETRAEGPGTAGTVANVGRLPVDFNSSLGAPPAASASGVARVPATTASTVRTETTEPEPPTTTAADDTSTTDGPTRTGPPLRQTPLGADAEGNRLLVIGDSITESLLPGYGGELCARLEDRGWYIGADAVNGRDADQGLAALERRLDGGDWDAAVINLGTNYRGDVGDYDATMRRILRRLGDRPVLLVTVTEWEDDIAEANYVIRSLAEDRDNVRVVDWADRTAGGPELTGGDGIHLSDTGRSVLTNLLVRAVGDAPGGGDPGCRQYAARSGSASGSGAGSGSDGGE